MQIDKNELLNQAKELLKEEVTQIAFQTWFSSMEIAEMNDSHIVLKASSPYCGELLQTRYADLILNTFKFITNREWTFSVISEENNKTVEENPIISSTPSNVPEQEIEISNKTLNQKYTFETFVVGNNNRFAHAAAIAVGDKPGESYNPLFLYGGVGLGKTHLMHAIGNRILQNNRSAKILYVTSEKFTNQLINAIKDNKNEVFRNKYRTIDVLLIDDIQFIAGKERVQEEFFHTFNALYEDKKQIIISSDKPPREIQFLEDRLKSRFEWGLLADISCPDYETRLAILRKKAQEEKILVDDSILANIANKIDSNIRELEGVFNKIIATASLTHMPITIELAENTINEFKAASEKVLSSDFVKETVAKYFNINKDDLASNKRSNEIAFPRQIAMYLCREVANMSYPKIGEDFGNRDHSTVMHACKKIEKEVKDKNNTRLIVESVKNIIINGEQ
ncbi:MAG: chromosomal replication initiator protein DnaA [Clostridia bacterium]|nr:chromosomal replication initiator protein DnaA [Clostridia bacterium]